MSIYNAIKLNSVNNLYVDNQVGLSRFTQGLVPDNSTEKAAFISNDSSELHFIAAAGNFNLSPESPVIDLGLSNEAVTNTDFTSEARDSAYDIGAFEYRNN